MKDFFLHIYDYFHQRRGQLWLGLAMVVALLCVLVTRIEYKEDIADFMPFDPEYRKAMQVYQEVAAGSNVVLMFSMSDSTLVDPAQVVAGVERYGEILEQRDSLRWLADNWQPQIDYSMVLDVFSYIYEHLPIYLTEADYLRMDSLMAADPDFVRHRLEADYEQLGTMAGSFMQPMLQHDPLGVGVRVAQMLQQYQPELQLQQYDGYIFTPDQRRCIVTVTSPFGSSETNDNARLVALLNDCIDELQNTAEGSRLEVCAIGSPVIAVSNAQQIKHDSLLAVSISAVLILVILLYAFRSIRSLLQIVIATGFGFLFALGFLGIFRDTLSVIVLGIASVIIGIAVNYPLHFLCHMQHQSDTRVTLRELVTPLFIGNVTTVGAFLTLVPLDAIAVRDLGIFSALMLVGTILFVLIVMPHITWLQPSVKLRHTAEQLDEEVHLQSGFSTHLVQSPWSLCIIALVTAVLGWFSLDTQFDSDLNHINFMTPRQRADLSYMSSLNSQRQGTAVFVSSSATMPDEALQAMESFAQQVASIDLDSAVLSNRNPVDLLPSLSMQEQRLAMWHSFWQRHGYGEGLSREFCTEAEAVGFAPQAFEPFEALLTQSFEPLTWEDFEPLTTTILSGMARQGQLVAQYQVAPNRVQWVEEKLHEALPGQTETEFHIFDLASLNSRVSDALSDNFNYIGFACGFIVFAFLWFSFRRFELAIIAFMPMAVGWVWILGLMTLLGIQFNLVNVILASFIFGQGDDYTIFVTEGLVREYREGKRVLFSYQRSIILSALIMLAGIGSLILAKHPAMHSLAQVTIIGMAVVVLMAWYLPPILFHWLVRYDSSLRRYLEKK